VGAILAPLVSSYICRYVYDAATMSGDVVPILNECLERFIASPAFKASSYYSGEFYGMDEPRLLETLVFVSVERANGAARFVNGDWSATGISTSAARIDFQSSATVSSLT
jgi:hypothetical protein